MYIECIRHTAADTSRIRISGTRLHRHDFDVFGNVRRGPYSWVSRHVASPVAIRDVSAVIAYDYTLLCGVLES